MVLCVYNPDDFLWILVTKPIFPGILLRYCQPVVYIRIYASVSSLLSSVPFFSQMLFKGAFILTCFMCNILDIFLWILYVGQGHCYKRSIHFIIFLWHQTDYLILLCLVWFGPGNLTEAVKEGRNNRHIYRKVISCELCSLSWSNTS